MSSETIHNFCLSSSNLNKNIKYAKRVDKKGWSKNTVQHALVSTTRKKSMEAKPVNKCRDQKLKN